MMSDVKRRPHRGGYEVSLFLLLDSVLLQVAMCFCKVQVIQSFVC